MATRAYVLKAAPAPKLRIDYARELNAEQLQAAEAPMGPCLIIAGAGSGKTRTLTYRLARMFELGVPLESMLLLTFTNKAAREMLRRVEELAGEMAETKRLLGGTFHHVAHTLLREHAPAVGFQSTFGLLDREDSRELMSSCLSTHKREGVKVRLPKADLLVDLVSMSVNTGLCLEELVVARHPQFAPLVEDLEQISRRYNDRKLQMNLMDFDDLLLHLRTLLQAHPAVRAQLSERFRAIFVDEYQDTNRLQGDIVDLLAAKHKNLTVVGDDAQSIYSFRGADFTNIIEFPNRYEGCRIYKLTENYRSTPQILSLANASIRQNKKQFPKELSSGRGAGPNPCIVPTRDVVEQASFVAQRLLELRDEGIALEQMAVLYRAHHHSMELQLELGRRGIPFEVRSGVRFFEQAHIKDVLAHLRFIHNPFDEIAFKRAFKLWPGVGAALAEQIWTAIALDADADSPLRALLQPNVVPLIPKRSLEGFRRCRELFEQLAQKGATKAPGEMIATVLAGGYADYLTTEFVSGERRKEDLQQLADYAARYPELLAFLNDIALLTELTAEDTVASDPPDERLTLSTVHQAKGLEWKAVFVIGLADGRFPMSNAMMDPDEEEEERRLFYVAATRAKDELYLSYPLTAQTKDARKVVLRASRFITELPDGEDAPYDRLMLEAARENPA